MSTSSSRLRSLRVRVDKNEHGITADLVFRARSAAIEEPRFTYRIGPRTMMDYTRLTQNGSYEGWIEIKGKRIEVKSDRFSARATGRGACGPSVRADSQPVAPPPAPQFYWLWAPMNFDDRITLYHNNADVDGKPWNTHAVMAPNGRRRADAHGVVLVGRRVQAGHAARAGGDDPHERRRGQGLSA